MSQIRYTPARYPPTHPESEASHAPIQWLTEQYLCERAVLVRTGAIVDATIIAASGSTKNQAHTRDPEMESTKKGRNWYFGLKAHIGSDPQGRVHRKATRGRRLTCADRAFNRKSNRVRARVEHVFGVIKHLWGYRRVRYRGLAKNAANLFTLFALANWYLVRRELAVT